MSIETECSLIGSTGCQGENPIALVARPLLANLCQGFANTTTLRRLTGRQFPDVSLAFTSKVGAARDSGEAKSFSLLVFCHEDHGLLSMLFDAPCNPVPGCHDHLLGIAPGRYADGQARSQTEDELSVGGNVETHTNHRTPPATLKLISVIFDIQIVPLSLINERLQIGF